MKPTPRALQILAREAFGLLLDLRDRENGHQLLTQAIAFLKVLGREKDVNVTPVMFSIRVMQLRKS